MFTQPHHLSKPGLFITGTDTGVGKTVITCAIAWSLRQRGLSVGVGKPFATGCKHEREGLVSPDTVGIAHFADCRQPLDVISPIRYLQPLAPGVAARESNVPPDMALVARCLASIESTSEAVLIEGIGGLLVPLDDHHTVLDLAVWLGYPVVVVARAGLGTLNHTAMTVRILREAGCRVAGLVVNGYQPDLASQEDASMATNLRWLGQMNQTPILATVPVCPADRVAPEQGKLPQDILESVNTACWPEVLATPRASSGGR